MENETQTVYVVGYEYSPGVDMLAIYNSEAEAVKHAASSGCEVFPWEVETRYKDEPAPRFSLTDPRSHS